ncbi:alpha/beta fold hydrolase [Microbacterium sp.]|uniref:alpha/beta fold hydrolase n=1 Tax=Microbacterium sp. TaxID=51671 RepID=UPI002638C7B7|nr:alpha/beta fold hydrolase [Microbacterium sp.]
MRVYVHGAGRQGRDAWPSIPNDRESRFASLDFTGPMDENVASLAALTPRDAVVFAHSAGAVPVFLALQARQIAARAVVLLEPGLYDVVRGVPVIEDHIEAMTRARALSRSGDLFGYWSIVRPLMFGGPADRSRWDEEREAAARFEAKQPPWGFGVESSAINGVPTLVVTGGWNAEYEAIAGVLVREGAEHVQLAGTNHRPQDHSGFVDAVDRFLASL